MDNPPPPPPGNPPPPPPDNPPPPLVRRYVLVKDGNDGYWRVTNAQGVTPPVEELEGYQVALDAALETAETAFSEALRPLGSGVRVKVPKIFD